MVLQLFIFLWLNLFKPLMACNKLIEQLNSRDLSFMSLCGHFSASGFLQIPKELMPISTWDCRPGGTPLVYGHNIGSLELTLQSLQTDNCTILATWEFSSQGYSQWFCWLSLHLNYTGISLVLLESELNSVKLSISWNSIKFTHISF